MNTAHALADKDDSLQWEGFERQRWSARYATIFAALYTPMIVFLLTATGMSGKGREVSSIVIAAFVATVLVGGLFLAKALAWQLDQDQRRNAVLITMLAGAALWLGILV